MAYGYKAHYGYYIDPNGQAHGVVTTLDGVNLNDCVITDRNTRFYIPEARDVVSPNSNTYSQDRTTKGKQFRDEITTTNYHGLPDWRYFSVLPGQPSASTINDQDWFQYMYWWLCQLPLLSNYNPFTIETVAKKGNPFFYCPNLARAMYPQLYGKVAKTFVYFPTWHKLMDQDGRLYTVSSTGLITQVIAGGNYWHNSATPTGISSGSVHCNWYGNYIVYNETTDAYTCMEYQITGYAGGQYSWIVWDDDHAVLNNTFYVGFFGFANGNYDFKSDIGGDPDPYSQVGENSKTGGGNGTGVIPGRQTTPIPGINDLPTDSILYRYKLDSGGIAAVTSALWSDDFLQAIKRTIYQPMDCIISMHYLPYDIETTGWSNSIHMGNYVIPNTASTEVAKQYQEIDCGSVRVNEIWGSYLDYHCRINLYLPFIGSLMLQPEDVVGHDLSVRYLFDNLTGTCVAHVISDDVVVGEYGGNCCYEIPLTGASYGELIGNLISLAGTSIAVVGSAVATGGVSAPLIAGEAATALSTAFSKENHQRAGGLGGASSLMNVRTPYLTVYVPNLCIPEDQNEFTGYPSYITVTLGSQHGYTEVYKSHVHINGASDAEILEIETLLNQGVIIA